MKKVPRKKAQHHSRNGSDNPELSADDWSEIGKGVALFNDGKFGTAQEMWENVTQRHPDAEGKFFRSLMQMASAYELFNVGSKTSVIKKLEEAKAGLEPFQPEYLGIHVQPLLVCIMKSREALEGKEAAMQIVPKLQFRRPLNPDFLVELREILYNEKFVEGSNLFNAGYHWEAHEAWEEVWREQEGNGKWFLQAFVQMASAYSFLKLKKFESAQYLFEKALEKFQELEQMECPIPLETIRQSLEQALRHFHNGEKSKTNVAPPSAVPCPHIPLLKDAR